MDPHLITVVIRYQSQPGKEDRAERELTKLVKAVTKEQGCIGIDIHQDGDDPTRFLLHERWTDRGIYLGAHMRTPHLKAFMERAPDFLAGPPEITMWRLLGSHGREPAVG